MTQKNIMCYRFQILSSEPVSPQLTSKVLKMFTHNCKCASQFCNERYFETYLKGFSFNKLLMLWYYLVWDMVRSDVGIGKTHPGDCVWKFTGNVFHRFYEPCLFCTRKFKLFNERVGMEARISVHFPFAISRLLWYRSLLLILCTCERYWTILLKFFA